MRKLYVVLTLLMSSFFLLSSSVSADTTIFEVNESEMEYVKTETFIIFREKLIEYCKENNCYYIIAYSDGQYEAKVVPSSLNINPYYGNTSNPIRIYKSDVAIEYYKLNGSDLRKSGTGSSLSIYFFQNNVFTYTNFLDTNFIDSKYTSDKNYLINYKDLSYEIVKDSHFPSLYEIYLESSGSTEEVDPKAEIVTNFYVLIIDKIKLLTDYIATDYIILSALVIFIFVAVIGLVRRLK